MYQARCIYLAYSMMVSIDSAQTMFKTLDRDTKKRRIAKEGVAANTVDVYNCRYNKNTTLSFINPVYLEKILDSKNIC